MADPDAEARLLDGIVGKYGDGSDYGDLGNADEDALLEGYDDPDFGEIKNSTKYEDTEELDHEPEEQEDILDLEAQDVELEEDELDTSNLSLSNSAAVSSTTQPEILLNQSELDERERDTDKFKNERENPPSKHYNIPDSLDEVPVSAPPRINQNRNGPRMGGQGRGRGGRGGANQRNNQMQKKRPDNNKTVLINPHFKGQVRINNETRLTWDARDKINQNKNQIGKVMPFSQTSRKPNETLTTVQPWIHNNNSNNLPQNVPQFQPPAPVYQSVFQQPPPQVTPWNQYPQNTFNQMPPQMANNNQQHVFMQPLPSQNMFNMHQFNHPPPQYTPAPPIFQNQNMNNQVPLFNNPQYAPPPNQFNQPPEPVYHQGFQQNHPNHVFHQPPNQFLPPPQQNINPQFNSPMNNRFVVNHQPNNNRNQPRFQRQKPNFNQGKGQFQNHNQKMSPPKRKIDNNADMRKKKRNQLSTNLHEVLTVETPDTTVKEEKQHEDEDEETKAYRKKIEEQKKLREQIMEKKELRRKQLAQKLQQSQPTAVIVNVPKIQPTPWQVQAKQPQQQNARNLQVVRPNPPIINTVKQSYPSTSNNNRPQVTRVFANQQQQAQSNRNIKIINTDSDESSYDKQHLASFLSNRKILAKDQSLIDTTLVVVSNLAAGTTDVKLRKMCQGIGDIKKLQMSPKERLATIQFNSVASAHAFFKKYQRTMLDLSMIQVALKPMP